jgi:hypothetical protein
VVRTRGESTQAEGWIIFVTSMAAIQSSPAAGSYPRMQSLRPESHNHVGGGPVGQPRDNLSSSSESGHVQPEYIHLDVHCSDCFMCALENIQLKTPNSTDGGHPTLITLFMTCSLLFRFYDAHGACYFIPSVQYIISSSYLFFYSREK